MTNNAADRTVPLAAETDLPAWIGSGPVRRNARSFVAQPLGLGALGRLLDPLRSSRTGETAKYRYPSAGGLYPVHTYLYVRSTPTRGVCGLREGSYYYDAAEHSLHELGSDATLTRSMHRPLNRPVFDQASLTLFMILDRREIEPVYGDASIRLATLEAGMMASLLDTAALQEAIGICHIGSLVGDDYRSGLRLTESHLLLHVMLAGVSVQGRS